MSLVKWKKGHEFPMTTAVPRPRITLAAVESLAVPLVQEVVFLADFGCAKCQERVAEILSKMNGETQSVMISVLEKKVTLTCTYPTADNLPSGRRRRQTAAAANAHRSSWSKILPVVRLFHNLQAINLGSHQSSMSGEVHCMVLKINLDCNACCRKMRRILLRMKEIETHLIEKQQNKVSVIGRFVPAEVAIKMRRKMKRRVEILEIQELGYVEQQMPPPVLAQPV